MRGEERRAAIAAYKERTSAVGVFAVRCAATGQCWVGGSRSLDTHHNRLRFALGMGHPNPALRAACEAHGPDAFGFEVLERLEEEGDAYLREAGLKRRVEHWLQALGAQPL
jgi:hypothetical protein